MTGDDFALTAGWGHFGQGQAVMPGQGRALERPYTTTERAALANIIPTPGNCSDSRRKLDHFTPRGKTEHGGSRPRRGRTWPCLTNSELLHPRQHHLRRARPHPRRFNLRRSHPHPRRSRPHPRRRRPTSSTTLPTRSADDAQTLDDTTHTLDDDVHTLDDTTHALDDTTHALGDTTFDIYLNDRAYWRNVPAAVWNYKLGGYQVLKKWLSYREHKVLDRPLKDDEVLHFTNTARRITTILKLTTS